MTASDVKAEIAACYEDLIMLCEIRGELDVKSNAETERRIAELSARLDELEKCYA